MVKAVIFDLDGVLVSTDELHYEAWKQLGEELGINNFTKEDNLRQRGVSRMKSLDVLLEKTDRVYTEEEKEHLAERKNEKYVAALDTLTPEAILPGVMPFLTFLKEKQIRIGVGSSSKNAPLILDKIGLRTYFDAVSSGWDTDHSKPDPDIFLIAAQKLGIPPEECVVIEDADAGITAARRAGMYAIAVGSAKDNQKADYGACSLETLPYRTLELFNEEAFCITENGFDEGRIAWYGNKFLTGNGYLGVRGTMEEYTKEQMCAINLAGVYDRVGNSWRESVNAPNPFYARVCVDGKEYALPQDAPLDQMQQLNFRYGLQRRKTRWQTEKGTLLVRSERFASMFRQHLLAMRYAVSADYDCQITITLGIDGDVWDIHGPHFVKTISECEGALLRVTGITGEKQIRVTTSALVTADGIVMHDCTDAHAYQKISIRAKAGHTYWIEEIASIRTTADNLPFTDHLETLSYHQLKQEQICAWNAIWALSEVTIDGDSEAELALNYSIYQLNCIAPRNLYATSIPARGLSGQVYKGAIFWDTEMFMLDYYIGTAPEIARTLLQYRINTLDGARKKAAEYGLQGAYYAWESQEGGYDACSDFNLVDVFTKRPVRTYFRDKQYHISAAIVYGFVKYLRATGDVAILKDGGLEVIVECARFYRSILIRQVDSEDYEIRDVIGPDEYHERVNNNAYTNRMAKFVFETAAALLEKMPYKETSIGSASQLREIFLDSAKKLCQKEPDQELLIEQFDYYFDLEDVDIETVRSRLCDPKEYWGGAHGVASDTQILKQADVVAMLGMFPEKFDRETMMRNLQYYEPRTEHGSSLSACMYALVACYTGQGDFAYPLFMKSAQIDLLPPGKEWLGLVYIGGTHPAAAGGAWIVAVKGFAGVSAEGNTLQCRPTLPKKWKRMCFKLCHQGVLYEISVTHSGSEIRKLRR